MTSAGRWYAYLLTATITLALLYPLTLDPFQGDSFPLSTFPMFSVKRENPRISTLVAVDGSGESRPLPPAVLGTEEVMQSAMTIRRAAANRKRARKLCREVADEIAGDPEWADATHVELLTLRYDPIAYFMEPDGPDNPISRKRRARCKIKRGQP